MGSFPRERMSRQAAAAASTNFAADQLSEGSATSMRWCGTPCISSGVGLAVPMSMRRYICIESAETISPPSSFASRTPSLVLPVAVGPVITTILGGTKTLPFFEVICYDIMAKK